MSKSEETTPTNQPVLGENDELWELGENFNFDEFQVVRREFFAHLQEPSVSFNNCKFYVKKYKNKLCIAQKLLYNYLWESAINLS